MTVHFNPSVFDIWVFRRAPAGVEFLLLHTSRLKADRFFNGGRFWQIPSAVFEPAETALAAIDRVLARYRLEATSVWAAEHTYTIYNRRFEEIQVVSVFAAALDRVHYRGLKDGLRSTLEYVTGLPEAAPQLRLR